MKQPPQTHGSTGVSELVAFLPSHGWLLPDTREYPLLGPRIQGGIALPLPLPPASLAMSPCRPFPNSAKPRSANAFGTSTQTKFTRLSPTNRAYQLFPVRGLQRQTHQ